MAVWTIDGTVEEADEARSRWSQTLYRSVVFRSSDGNLVEEGKLAVADDIKEFMAPGQSGRFYLHKAVDQKGIHGVRTASGEAACAYPMFMIRLYAILLVLGVPGVILNWMMDGIGSIATLMGLIAVTIAAVMLPLLLRSKSEATAQFDDDKGFPPVSD